MLIDLVNETDLPVETEPLEAIAKTLTERQIELIVTDNEGIRALNAKHREKDVATDVLSFPMKETIPGIPLGAIVISKDFVIHHAKMEGHTPQEELTLLFIHGLLHLLGYDHETDKGEMRKKEEEIILRWHLPPSLIVRQEKGNL